MQGDLNQRLACVVEHQVVVWDTVPDWVVRADDVEERGEERKCMTILRRSEEGDPLVGRSLRVACNNNIHNSEHDRHCADKIGNGFRTGRRNLVDGL